ncbi:hypothetical protein niasHS_000621 [Heterodera schachtii]|uniref:Transmembrane protein n=1 Tax=Heterodera schachtii TaxID=97005 RepID=A0ABD2K4R6_HETSC
MDTSSPPSTSSVCTLSASVAPMSPKPSKAKIVSSSLCRPSAFANAIGLPCGPFAALLMLLLLCCPLSAMPPFGHAPSDQSHSSSSLASDQSHSSSSLASDQSHSSSSLASAAFSPSPSSVSLVLVAPSADSPSPAAPLFPPGGPANFALPAHWQNNHFPYGRTNRNQQQQQKAHATATAAAAAAGVHRQNLSPNGLPAESVPNISPLAAWGRHQQTMRAKQNQQRQQWPYSQTVPNSGWPNSFSPIANPQQNGMEPNKKSSPFEGVPSFRSQYHQNRRKFTGGGLSRLVLSSEEEEQSAELEQSHASTNWQQMAQRTTMVTPSSNHPTLNNFERYMPLLARHRPPPKNGTARWSLANSAEPSTEERNGQSAGGDRAEREQGTAEEEDEAGSDARMGGGPCVSANCRTWITITIPSELVGLGGAETNGETQHKERPPAHKAIVTQSKPSTNGGWTKPNTVPFRPKAEKPNTSLPMQPIQPPKSRGMPTARGGTTAKNGVGETTISPQTNLPVTTRQAPPGFVFSTKWILPVNGLSVRPNGTSVSPSSISTTTPTISTMPPFTIGPRPKVSPTQPPAIPRERPSDKMRPPKPWTHTSGGKEKASNVPKSRPEQTQQPNPTEPTTDQTIEQAAIWASTELIDAIREALAKFRAALSRQGARSRKQQDGTNGEGAEGNWEGQPNYEDEEWPTQLKTAWDSLRGTWLEKAVAELAMDAASNGRTEISDGKIAELLQKAGLMDATELDRIKGTKSGE